MTSCDRFMAGSVGAQYLWLNAIGDLTDKAAAAKGAGLCWLAHPPPSDSRSSCTKRKLSCLYQASERQSRSRAHLLNRTALVKLSVIWPVGKFCLIIVTQTCSLQTSIRLEIKAVVMLPVSPNRLSLCHPTQCFIWFSVNMRGSVFCNKP